MHCLRSVQPHSNPDSPHSVGKQVVGLEALQEVEREGEGECGVMIRLQLPALGPEKPFLGAQIWVEAMADALWQNPQGDSLSDVEVGVEPCCLAPCAQKSAAGMSPR